MIEVKLANSKANICQVTHALGVVVTDTLIESKNAQLKANPAESVAGCITLNLYVV